MVRTVHFFSDIVSAEGTLDYMFYILIKKKKKILHFFRRKSFFMVLESTFLILVSFV